MEMQRKKNFSQRFFLSQCDFFMICYYGNSAIDIYDTGRYDSIVYQYKIILKQFSFHST